jgi:hypothetical protein
LIVDPSGCELLPSRVIVPTLTLWVSEETSPNIYRDQGSLLYRQVFRFSFFIHLHNISDGFRAAAACKNLLETRFSTYKFRIRGTVSVTVTLASTFPVFFAVTVTVSLSGI